MSHALRTRILTPLIMAAALHGQPALARYLFDLPPPRHAPGLVDGLESDWPRAPHPHPPVFVAPGDEAAPTATAPPTPVATVQQMYAAFAQGDLPRLLGALAADVRWREAEGGPYGGTYIGPQAVREGVFVRIGADWRGFQAQPLQVVADGQTVVVRGRYSGTYGASGKPLSVPFVHVWTVLDGQVRSFEQYTDTALQWRAMAP